VLLLTEQKLERICSCQLLNSFGTARHGVEVFLCRALVRMRVVFFAKSMWNQ